MKDVLDNQVIGPARTEDNIKKIKEIFGSMCFFAFDSFSVLPSIISIDKQGNDFSEGKYSCTQQEFLNKLIKEKFPINKLVVVPG